VIKPLTKRQYDQIDVCFLDAFHDDPAKLAAKAFRHQVGKGVAKELAIPQAQVDKHLRDVASRNSLRVNTYLSKALEQGMRLTILRLIEGMNAMKDGKPDVRMRHKYTASFARMFKAIYESRLLAQTEGPEVAHERSVAQRQADIVAEREQEQRTEDEPDDSKLVTHLDQGHHRFGHKVRPAKGG